jgi:steroid 5-alpha reductase family enzyme
VATRKALICGIVTVWGLRLSLHILIRNWSKPEDFRYQKWRREAGAAWWWQSFLKVFFLQGVIMWIVAAPLLAAQIGVRPRQLTWLDFLAILLWLVGFFFEAVGDWQLGGSRRTGQQGQSAGYRRLAVHRHPNYFGDATQWWDILSYRAGGRRLLDDFQPYPDDGSLLSVSGVTLLDEILKETKRATKNMRSGRASLCPWFPRKEK